MTVNTAAIDELRSAIERVENEIIGNEEGVLELNRQITVYDTQIAVMRKQIASYEMAIAALGGSVGP